MTDIIPPENKELLAHILRGAEEQIAHVVNVQEKVAQLPQLDIPVFNYFAPNIYMRQMDAKAGTFIVSKMHRTEHFIMFLKGSCSVLTDDGVELIKAPCVLRTMPGTKRAGYFHEDTSCITIHPTDSTDLEEIEKQVIVPEEEIDQFLALLQSKCKEIE